MFVFPNIPVEMSSEINKYVEVDQDRLWREQKERLVEQIKREL